MRLLSLSALAIIGSIALPARGETLPPPASSSTSSARPGLGAVAIGVNSPFSWWQNKLTVTRSFGASLYAGLGAHHAIRANLAFYRDSKGLGTLVEGMFGDGDVSYGGSYNDVGLAWVWYPRQLWSGFSLEAGALRRDRDTKMVDYIADRTVETDSTTYAARTMIGWSWVIYRHVFVAVALGISVGREAGRETATVDRYDVPMTAPNSVGRVQVDGEGYLRIGFAYGH